MSTGFANQVGVRGPISLIAGFGARSEALLPATQQTGNPTARALQPATSRLIGCTFIFKLCCVTAWAAEHHFNMQIDSSEALHYAFSACFQTNQHVREALSFFHLGGGNRLPTVGELWLLKCMFIFPSIPTQHFSSM